MMNKEIASRLPLDSFYHCLVHAAHQFKFQKGNDSYLLAGYHWFKCRARDTFIALTGLTLAIGETEEFETYMATASKAIYDFINQRPSNIQIYEMDKPDVLLWATRTIQNYSLYTSPKQCYEKYGDLLKAIMEYIWNGKHPNLFLHENGLLYSNGKDTPITWMNSVANGKPIIPRSGYIVEFNALWYNALKFLENILLEEGTEDEQDLANRLHRMAEKVAISFKNTFLNEYGYLLDYVDGNMMDWSVRPNQLIAIYLEYSPLNIKERKGVLDVCTKELVTPKGIRSLSPKSGGYNPMYIGKQLQRDYAYHQGTAWP